MSVLNYFIVLPAYSLLVGMEMNDTIKLTSVVAGVLPFNFIKGVIVSLLFISLFMKLRDWIESKHASMINRKSTRLNSSHVSISYAVFCLKKKKINQMQFMHAGYK